MTIRYLSMISRLAMIGIVIPVLAACSFTGDQDHARVTVIRDQEQAINPVGSQLNFASATMRAAMARGLVGLDEEGRAVPALAARWIITDDGLSYIFRLYDAKWDDGRQVTAERIARLLTERFDELGNSRLADDLLTVDEVVSMTGRVVEIRLKSPQPNFLQLLAQPEMGLFRSGHGAGPMRLMDQEKGLKLGLFEEPSKSEKDEDSELDDRWVSLRDDPAAKAIARFNLEQTDVILNGKFHHLPLVEQAEISTNDIRLDPVAGLFGLLFIKAEGFWTVPGNREILAMAIDRPALLTSFPIVSAWKIRHKIIPEALNVPGVNTRPDWSAMTMEDRRNFAQEGVRQWKADGPIRPLRIMLPDAPGAEILFLRIRSDLRRVGLDIKRAENASEADVELIDEIAPHNGARWFLSRLTCQQTPVCLNDADAKIEEADAATNLETQARLYAETEKILVGHYNFIPLGTPVRWSIVRPGQLGFAANPRGWHPLNTLIGIPIS